MYFGYQVCCLTLALTFVLCTCFGEAKPGVNVDVKVGVNGKQVIHAQHPSNVGLDDDEFIPKPVLPSSTKLSPFLPIDGTPDDNPLNPSAIDSRPGKSTPEIRTRRPPG